ncbi:group-specific protein [Domibacillus enclensis]|uniref:Group-specific protein n=1 Tax=Domibacillus enclensis TaxID=1017273 RepID=A0A1N6WKK5_9BACI|nr:group-specific protein [Domibacillus enclensis]OXS77965.1 group-specific protein [Domibacillus enclensis]SIQ90592.1 hypothetical protein SAMN05443094_104198 [Domibacillus enclensis]
MLKIELDELEVERIYREELRKRLNELEHHRTFWDWDELCRQTCMSKNFIREQFFFDPRFPKYQVGRKWLFPAKATEEFLLQWLSEQ